MRKGFPSVPNARFILYFFMYGFLFYGFIAYKFFEEQFNVLTLIIACLFAVGCLCVAVSALPRVACTIQILPEYMVCKIPFHKDIVIQYEQCNIGMDYHIQHGQKVWWIYLCYGPKPTYKTMHPGKRINSLKCQDGFIRMIYRQEIYDALLCVLPKDKQVALTSAKKFASID